MVDFQSREPRTREDDGDEDGEEPEEPAEQEEEAGTSPEATSEEDAETSEPEDSIAYAVVTVSGERSLSEDTQGDTVVEIIEDAGARVTTRDLINTSYDGVQSSITTLAKRDDVDAIVTIGGTGVEPADVTVDATEPLFDKRLPGFGELFRRLAAADQGSTVVGTRATAGILAGTPVFVVPGTIGGAVLATEDIIVPEAGDLAAAAKPPEPTGE
jgi:molybdenum cofactor biosynthesis protein B